MSNIRVGACISEAWDLFKANIVIHVVCSLLATLVSSLSAGLLLAPMMVGYMRMIERQKQGEAIQMGDIFRGFDDFVPSFVAGLISLLVIAVGLFLCVIPGLLIMMIYTVSLYLVAQGERDGVAAFNQAWKLVTGNLLSMALGGLLLSIIGSIGFLLCWVGGLLTMPIALIASHLLAKQLVGDKAVTAA